MEEFIKWFLENWNANIFTLFTVLLSGIISLIISAAYYRKGNRNNLKMSVIHPIISILNDSYSRNNYKKIEEIARERAKQLFNAEHANVQPHSGSQANMGVYLSVLQPGDTVLGMNLTAGGHLTHGHPLNLSLIHI